MIDILPCINGEWKENPQQEWLPVFEPATGKQYARLANASLEDFEQALQGAQVARSTWAKTAKEERSRILLKISSLIEENLELLAQAETRDNGKPIAVSRAVDIPRAAKNMAFFATAILHDTDNAYPMGEDTLNYTKREPLGVVGCISPWNLPLYLFTWKIAPALASGNCVIAKPSEITPYTAFLFSKLCKEAGLPDGVLQVLHGKGGEVGDYIVSSPAVKAISFTGGTATGKIIARKTAEQFKKVSLELGGKNPVLVFKDADLGKAVSGAVKSAFSNQGQICLCGSRIYVEQEIYDEFVSAFVAKTKRLKVENPFEDNTRIGAMVSKEHLAKVQQYICWAEEDGGVIRTGGYSPEVRGGKEGYYLAPTVITGLEHHCRSNMQEIFGPVVAIHSFKGEEQALSYANDTPYGLAAVIWTNQLQRAHRMAAKLDTGIVWVNTWLKRDLRTPFGGTKASGVGREGGFHALHFFTESKTVCIDFGE